MRLRALSSVLVARLMSGTAAWPIRSSGTEHKP